MLTILLNTRPLRLETVKEWEFRGSFTISYIQTILDACGDLCISLLNISS